MDLLSSLVQGCNVGQGWVLIGRPDCGRIGFRFHSRSCSQDSVPHGLLASDCPQLLSPIHLSDGLPVATPGEWVTFAMFLWLEASHRSQPHSREGNYMGPPEGRLPAILHELYKSGYGSTSPAPKTVQSHSRCSVNVCGLSGCLSTHR